MIWLKRILTWTIRLMGGLVAAMIALFVVVILVGGGTAMDSVDRRTQERMLAQASSLGDILRLIEHFGQGCPADRAILGRVLRNDGCRFACHPCLRLGGRLGGPGGHAGCTHGRFAGAGAGIWQRG